MKLKSIPEDFVVHELSSYTPDPEGRLFVYELEKRSLATMEALGMLARLNDMRVRDLSAAGLKDKHGLTRQLFSSVKPLRVQEAPGIRVTAVGKCAQPLTAASIRGNAFRVTMRNLHADETERILSNTAEVRAHGVPNYYDNQRFGGIAHGQGFIGKALAGGDFEEALRLHLAAAHRKQSLKDKQNRRLAAKLWGDWDTLHRKMRRSPERALVEFLRDHPGQWAECFDRIPPTLRTLFVAAYQSFLFNEILNRWVRDHADETVTLKNRAGPITFFRQLKPDTDPAELPLPGGSTNPDDFPHARAYLAEVLANEGVTLESLRLPGLQRTRFKASIRNAVVTPGDLQVSAAKDDDLNPGRFRQTAEFTLPRGSFATIVTRRLVVRWDADGE
jgi:tRNA pseudouridine13 synthase